MTVRKVLKPTISRNLINWHTSFRPGQKNTGERHRLVSAEGQLLDLIDP